MFVFDLVLFAGFFMLRVTIYPQNFFETLATDITELSLLGTVPIAWFTLVAQVHFCRISTRIQLTTDIGRHNNQECLMGIARFYTRRLLHVVEWHGCHGLCCDDGIHRNVEMQRHGHFADQPSTGHSVRSSVVQ